jgi:hypothetical protein
VRIWTTRWRRARRSPVEILAADGRIIGGMASRQRAGDPAIRSLPSRVGTCAGLGLPGAIRGEA